MARYTKREHAAGKFWLDVRPNSPAYCICWIEGRQVRRKSTGTDDLEAAKRALEAHYLAEDNPESRDVARVLLAELVHAYYEQHARHLPARKWMKNTVAHWICFYGKETVWAATRAAGTEHFIDDLRGRGLKPSSVNAILTAGRAALNRSWKRSEISRQVFVPSLKVTQAAPKGRPLSVEECARWLDASAPHFHALLFICLAREAGLRP